MAENSGYYGSDGKFAFVPVGIGFLAGAFFVCGADWIISKLGLQSTTTMIGKLNIRVCTWKIGTDSLCKGYKYCNIDCFLLKNTDLESTTLIIFLVSTHII